MRDPAGHDAFGARPANSPGVSFLTLVGVELRRLWLRRSSKVIAVIALFCASLAWLVPLVLLASVRPSGLPFLPVWVALSAQAAIICSGFMCLATATFIAGEFTTGSMSNWLTFEPRRIRVAASKYAAVLLGTVALMAVACLISAVGALALGATDFGSTGLDNRDGIGADIAPGWPFVRALFLCLFCVLATACVALVVRNTSGTIGAFMLWGLIIEGFLAGALTQGRLSPFLPGANATAFVSGGLDIPVGVPDYSGGSRVQDSVHIGLPVAAAYLVVLGILLVVGSLAVFHRRDVA